MSNAPETQTSDDPLIQDTGMAPEPDHDAWFRQEVEAALRAEREGRVAYHDLRAVAADYGFDAS